MFKVVCLIFRYLIFIVRVFGTVLRVICSLFLVCCVFSLCFLCRAAHFFGILLMIFCIIGLVIRCPWIHCLIHCTHQQIYSTHYLFSCFLIGHPPPHPCYPPLHHHYYTLPPLLHLDYGEIFCIDPIHIFIFTTLRMLLCLLVCGWLMWGYCRFFGASSLWILAQFVILFLSHFIPRGAHLSIHPQGCYLSYLSPHSYRISLSLIVLIILIYPRCIRSLTSNSFLLNII